LNCEEYLMDTNPKDFFSPDQWKPLSENELKQLQIDYLERMKAQPVDRKYNPYIPELLESIRALDASNPLSTIFEISKIVAQYGRDHPELNWDAGDYYVNATMYCLLDTQIRNWDTWKDIQFYPTIAEWFNNMDVCWWTLIASIPQDNTMKPYIVDGVFNTLREHTVPTPGFEFDMETLPRTGEDARMRALMSPFLSRFESSRQIRAYYAMLATILSDSTVEKFKRLSLMPSRDVKNIKGMIWRYYLYSPELATWPNLLIDIENEKLVYKKYRQ